MKKIIALLMAVLMTAGMLAACSGTPAETTSPAAENTKAQAETAAVSAEKEKVALKVWADQGELELTEKLCSEFAAEHPEKEYTFEYGAVGAVDGKARYLEDPAAAADVFLFADDQLVDLVKADALYEVTRNTDAIIAANTPGSINAATYDGTLYGYPMTSDNGYFLYYDKSVFTEDDLKTLDGILAAANAAGKKVHMDVSNGWYLASFFLGNGCTLTIEDGKQVIDFNNANGLAAAEAIRAFCNDPAFVTGDDSVLAGGIGDAIACGVSGTWVASAIQEKLGDNYGLLPGLQDLRRQLSDRLSRGRHGAGGVSDRRESPDRALQRAELWPVQCQRAGRRHHRLQPGASGSERTECVRRFPDGSGRLLDACRSFRRGAGSPFHRRSANHAGSACGAGAGRISACSFRKRGCKKPLFRHPMLTEGYPCKKTQNGIYFFAPPRRAASGHGCRFLSWEPAASAISSTFAG